MAIDYNDNRFIQNAQQEAQAMNEVTNTYQGMIDNSDSYYNQLKAETEAWGNKQTEIQNAQTEQTIKEIGQQQEKTEREYQKEAKGSYADYQRQLASNTAGMINSGLQNSGYSESSQVSMYNTYQNRLATAKQSYMDAVQNYDNQKTQARLANNAAIAQIAHDTLQKSLELSLQGFQYKNQLTIDLMNQKQNLSNTYWQRRLNIESQINSENALAEQIRQFNEKMAFDRQQADRNYQLQQQELSLKKSTAKAQNDYYNSLTNDEGLNNTTNKTNTTTNTTGNSKKNEPVVKNSETLTLPGNVLKTAVTTAGLLNPATTLLTAYNLYNNSKK